MGDPTTRIITSAELDAHCTKQDAWIAIRGKVFDITSYIQQHPGGVTPISKALGKDGTELFDSVHSYVRFEEILKGKQVGVLEVSKKRGSIQKEKDKALQAKLLNKTKKKGWCGCCGGSNDNTEGFPDTDMYESSNSIVYAVTFKAPPVKSEESDWTVGIKNQKVLCIRKLVGDRDVWLAQLKLTERLTDDLFQLNFENNFNTMEVTLNKPVPGMKWKSIGIPDGDDHNQILDSRSVSISFEACIVHKEPITENVFLFGMQMKPSVRFGLPIGFHVQVCIGNHEKRSYTPICYSMMGEEEPKFEGDGQVIWFIIKIYPKGYLTQFLNKIEVGKPDDSNYPLTLGAPAGNFSLDLLTNVKTDVVMLFAGGTGITPFTRIISWYLEKVRQGECAKHVILMYWNRMEPDIIWKEQWKDLDAREPWFHFFPILTGVAPISSETSAKSAQAPPELQGHASTKLIKTALDTLPFDISSSENKQGMICGPTGFISAVEESLQGIISLDNVHIFAS